MKVNKLLLITATFILVLACSKSDDDNSPLAEVNPLRVSNYKVGINRYDVFYDDDFKPILIEGPNNNLEIEYNNDGLISKHGDYQYTYDATGKISTVIDLNPFSSSTDVETTTQNYDSNGRLIEIIASTPNSFFANGGELIRQINFLYDTTNRLVEVIEMSNATNFSRFNKFELEYDTNNNINKITELSSENGTNYTTGNTSTYIYDNKNNPERLFLELANVDGDFIRFEPIANYILSVSFAGIRYVPKNNIIRSTITGNNISQFHKR